VLLAGLLVLGVTLTGQNAGTPSGPGLDLAGYWSAVFHQDAGLATGGGMIGDYGGIPINEAGRMYALSWDASRMTVRQQQCPGYVIPYFYFAPQSFRFWEERDPYTQELIAIKMYTQTSEQTRTIWMDGRPHPGPNAPHTWMGFSTGRYDGDMLIVETTHLKKGWVRRNGVPMSDQAKMTEYMVRNGEVMSHIFVLVDPVYLTEPLVKSQEFVRSARELPAGTWLWVCDPVLEIATREEGEVPAYLPGEHPFKDEYARRHQLPEIALRGGAASMYPEFQELLKKATIPPPLPKPQPGATRVTGAGQQQQAR
jgi:hypothetical protein